MLILRLDDRKRGAWEGEEFHPRNIQVQGKGAGILEDRSQSKKRSCGGWKATKNVTWKMGRRETSGG
jgi:hypothetical protein